MSTFFDSQIVSVTQENEWVRSFYIRPVPEPFLHRKPGQYLLMAFPMESGWSSPHPFTITSGSKDDSLKITVKRIGVFTTELHGAALPVDVKISGPLGDFGGRIDQEEKIVFIAGGIGITPFISLLSHLADSGSTSEITLFWANNHLKEFFAIDFLSSFLKKLRLRIILVAAEKDESLEFAVNGIFQRYGHLTSQVLREFIPADQAHYHMCGSENMQKYIFSQLNGLDVLPDKVETEKFGIYMKENLHPV